MKFQLRYANVYFEGYTAIAGKKMYMEPGDLVITPSMAWHDHGNEGTTNVIWLDGLNIPFFKHIPVDFFDLYEEEFGVTTHESKIVTDEECTEMKFPWKKTKAQLDASKGEHAIFEYRLPDAKHVNPIVGASAEKIMAGKSTVPRQDTANRIYQVHSGRGVAKISDPKGKNTYELAWGPADTFTVPSWYRFTIHADEGEAAYLFTFSDIAMLEHLNLYRKKV
jgi:gentisate 1,2-dioxygenase